MNEEEKRDKLTSLVAEVRASNDVLHEQLKHLHELFSEKLDRIQATYKVTCNAVDKNNVKIEELQVKITELNLVKNQIQNLNNQIEENKSEASKIDSKVELVKSETEIARVEQRNPFIAKNNNIGKFMQNIAIILACVGVLYEIFFS
jgi:NACalpha-BTF3-like transcription factor